MASDNGKPKPLPPHLAAVKPPPKYARIPVRMGDVGNAVITGTPIEQVMTGLERYCNDPLGFVMWAFPWGEHGTSLENMQGPEDWQREQLERLRDRLQAGGAEGCVIEEDVTAGRGVGKSALVSWLILWAISTFKDTRGVVTANTDSQLKTKTWAELSKWHQMFIARELFTFTATAIYIAGDKTREKAWRIDAIPWSETNVEAFNGLHNQGKRILVIFDEASGIIDPIFEGMRGALTDGKTQIMWLRYGNPTRTSGQFFSNCTKPRRNKVTRVDSREVSFTNKAEIAEWILEHGEDSDFVRVHVKGMFPRAGFSNFISPELVFNARRRRLPPEAYKAYPKVLAIDPARFGDDFSVITLRQGLLVHWQVALSGFDGVDLAGRVVDIVRREGGISCIVYDAIGNGADLDSMLRRAPGLPALIAVQWGVPATDDKQYTNQRSECWGKMRDFLEHGRIPDEDELADQITSLDYGYDAKLRIALQSKKDCKKNGGKSPDRADSLALSFVPDMIKMVVRRAKVIPVKRRTVVWSRTA